ncbi:MAG TPA: protease pro-enzyme activation domain-containing protein [Candidatus Nitrosopolaris sp.]|nr:protease pro-enzyme activation domain-containing protein [Candidatus Nitrosopolaris sp.]
MNQRYFLKTTRILFAISLTILLPIPFTTFAQMSARQFLHGHVPDAIGYFHLQPVGRLPATNRLNLAIGLPLRNRAALNELLRQIYDPTSPNFRHYLTPAEFAERFGPTAADYKAVIAFARANGLTVTGAQPDHTVLDVSGSVAENERIFHVTMRLYRHPGENRDFFAPDTEPSIDLAVPLLHVSGLDNFIVPHPASLKMIPLGRASAVRSANGTGPSSLFMGKDFRAAYVPGVSLTGSNQIVGLFELDGYYSNDITAYETNAGLPNITLTNVLINTGGAAGGNNGEVALDIEMAISMAPGLSEVIVYEGPNPASSADIVNILGAMYTNNLAKQLSSSWLIGDDPNYDTMYIKFATQGQCFFQASGDDGAYYSGIGESADDTNITIVGGTTLSTAGPGGPYLSETVWNEYSNGEGAGGSGGGISLNSLSIPSWQTGINMTTNQGSTTLRNIPDVAMNADNIFAVENDGQQEFAVGTSAAAPLWAGFAALVNQQAVASGQATVGFINPAIYAIGKSPYYPFDFHDITTGSNTNTTISNKYFAVPGYDLCTGWGTPAGQNLITALATPDALGVLPGTGFTANGPVGGPFNVSVENFSLTNSGTSSLNWATLTPSWLTATPGSGTLPTNSSAAVAVSVNSASSGLLPAAYTANVAFTNLTSGIAQIRTFTLQVGQSLVQNGGFETGDFSYWTFVGDLTDSGGAFENGVVGTNTFSGDLGTNWIHSGAYGAALGEEGKLAYLFQTLPVLPGQSYLLSFWFNNIGGATPNQFLVDWDTNLTSTNTIFNQINVPALNNWTNMLFIVAATSTNAVLQFGEENDNGYFGLDDIALLPVPAPTFRAVAATNNAIQFTWNSLMGLVYQVQYSTNLVQTNWINLGSSVTATNFTLTATNSIGRGTQRFYRIQWVH